MCDCRGRGTLCDNMVSTEHVYSISMISQCILEQVYADSEMLIHIGV
jgi:hypothetical protein